MGEIRHTHKQVEDRRPTEVKGVPGEEDVDEADAVDRVDLDPGEQLNRPDQPDFDPAEREPFVNERAIADADRPEDR